MFEVIDSPCSYGLPNGEDCGAGVSEHGPEAEYDYLRDHDWRAFR